MVEHLGIEIEENLFNTLLDMKKLLKETFNVEVHPSNTSRKLDFAVVTTKNKKAVKKSKNSESTKQKRLEYINQNMKKK